MVIAVALYEGEFQVWGFLTAMISKQSKPTTSQHPDLMQADVPQNIYDNPLECTDAIHPAGRAARWLSYSALTLRRCFGFIVSTEISAASSE
jgi:hypothetical protein